MATSVIIATNFNTESEAKLLRTTRKPMTTKKIDTTKVVIGKRRVLHSPFATLQKWFVVNLLENDTGGKSAHNRRQSGECGKSRDNEAETDTPRAMRRPPQAGPHTRKPAATKSGR